MKKPEKKKMNEDALYNGSSYYRQHYEQNLSFGGYNDACDEWEKYHNAIKLTKKEIKTELIARNEWFYQYLSGEISIGRFCERLAQAIIDLQKKKESEG